MRLLTTIKTHNHPNARIWPVPVHRHTRASDPVPVHRHTRASGPALVHRHTRAGGYPLPRRDTLPPHTHSSSFPYRTPLTPSSYLRRQVSIAPQGLIFVNFSHPTKIINPWLFIIGVAFHVTQNFNLGFPKN